MLCKLEPIAVLVLLALALPMSPAIAAGPSVADLVAAYPDQLKGVEGNELVWRDGTRMPISDGVAEKDFATRLERPDIDDMFAIPYRAGPPATKPGVDEDPGRVRYEPFFAKMYGDCARGEVAPRTRHVKWLSGSLRFTTVNGAADRLEAVVRDLKKLPKSFIKYLVPSAGTFNCRMIAGTGRRSMHAYGAAIDINTAFTDYWQWSVTPSKAFDYHNRIPFEIVEIFERHGFIWGGKWYHYDTMHFEYRPELLPRPDQ